MSRRQIAGFVELAPPQLLDDKWREFTFDLAEGQNILQDLVTPETGSGYVYRDAKQVGSATHNRFIYWRTFSDIIELVEISTEVVLEDNQVRIKFINSPVISDVKLIEMPDLIVIMLATISSVHRLYLPHPKLTNRSILSDLTSDVLFNPSNYHIMGGHNSLVAQQPISATSWFDKPWLKCALSFPDSSLLIVSFGHQTHHITTSEIKQSGIIGRLWSKMPNLWAKSPNECDNAIFALVSLHVHELNDVLLFTLCRDCRVRVFSTTTRECVCSYNMIPQSSFHQSFAAHNSPAIEMPSIKIFESQVVVYMAGEFVFLNYEFQEGQHELRESIKIPAPGWEKLIDFVLNRERIWALGYSESDSTLYYMDLDKFIPESQGDISMMVENTWDHVNAVDEVCRSIVADIFWSNRFSTATVQKALFGISGPTLPKKNTMEELEELAATRIVDDNQDDAWTRFYDYCLQNHQTANKNLGLLASDDGSMMLIIKRSNPSFICPHLASSEDAGPYRGLEMPPNLREFMKPLNTLSTDLMDDQLSNLFERRLFENPSQIMVSIDNIVQSLLEKLGNTTKQRLALFINSEANLVEAGLDFICDTLDLTRDSQEFNNKILADSSTLMRSEHRPLASNTGIILTYELFKQLARARMTLARDLILYLTIIQKYAESDRADSEIVDMCERLGVSGKMRCLLDCLRSYAILVWVAETPIKNTTAHSSADLINQIARQFEFFKTHREVPNRANLDSSVDRIIHRHLLMNFLAAGGINFTWSISKISHDQQTLSNSHYMTETTLNLCKLLWPASDHLCIAEFMYTQHLDEHLAKYLEMMQDWLNSCSIDRHFLRALNCMLQNRAQQGVEIFNRLWMKVSSHNFIGRFLELDQEHSTQVEGMNSNPDLIFRYYDKLIQLCHSCNNRQCSVILINHCLSLIDEKTDYEQHNRISSLRAKLFQYYLELEDSDEAYHTMVMTKDVALRTNCLRKFIVSHCEKKQWMKLLSYPYIDIKNDFIEILNQKAENLDLSHLNDGDFYKTTYYDILFSSYVSDENYKSAAYIMYNYAQRLAQEVPGVRSIRKQSDCLLIALNSLRCVDDKDRFLSLQSVVPREKSKTSILKRTHDSELDSSVKPQSGYISSAPADIKIDCTDIKRKYELTRARLRLLEKDQTANAIALSPLKPEETIAQLVGSSMFSAALDLALLFGSSMEPILDGLTAKYIMVLSLTSMDLSIHQDIEKSLLDIFTNSYSNIDTYNYVANSSSPLLERLWRLIDYYLVTYDGIGHKYKNTKFADSFGGSTVLMRVVANKLLLAGCDVPASLRRLYLHRNTSELLKLFIKYNKLMDAAELAIEMFERLREPSNQLITSSQYADCKASPMYLPTHLILALINYLREDATNIHYMETAKVLQDKLEYFRLKTCQDCLR